MRTSSRWCACFARRCRMGWWEGTQLSDHVGDSQSRELSSDSSDDCHDEAKKELKLSIHRRDELQKEVKSDAKEKVQKRFILRQIPELAGIQEMAEEKEQLVSDLKKKSQKLVDALADAKKLTSQRQVMLTKLHRCFLQTEDYAERVKSSEQELRMLVDASMAEVDAAEDGNMRNGSGYANGQV